MITLFIIIVLAIVAIVLCAVIFGALATVLSGGVLILADIIIGLLPFIIICKLIKRHKNKNA